VNDVKKISDNLSTCETRSGKACIFPFIYKGVTYTKCTSKELNIAWCATKLNANGATLRAIGADADFCMDSCIEE